MRSIQVLVIGGGASGMTAAITSARQGKKVMILEKMNCLGKKILATGNGKCNFTNRHQNISCYGDCEEAFLNKAFSKFSWEDAIDWFHDMGVLAKERDGYWYPRSGQAATILHALEREIKRLRIEVHTEEVVTDISFSEKRNGFIVTSAKGDYLAKNVILATGGMASPVHGSSGDGYDFVKVFGHTVIPPVPALTSLILAEKCTKDWTGVRLQGEVTLCDDSERVLAKDRGEIQMVNYGISGIPVFQISRYAARACKEQKKLWLYLDSMTEFSMEQIQKELLSGKERNPAQSMGDLLEGLMHQKMASILLKRAGIKVAASAGEISAAELYVLAKEIKQMKLAVKDVSDFTKAQVTCGGVSTVEVGSESMESAKQKGLYIIGELLDVDGICGGYNLQWAWTSGYLAGMAAGKDK